MYEVTYDDLLQDGLSDFDLQHMSEIIRGDMGDWFHARLLRALHLTLPYADARNMARLEQAFPGSVAAYKLWHQDAQHPLLYGASAS